MQMVALQADISDGLTCVVSLGFLRIALSTWYMGVMPLPPASMPAREQASEATKTASITFAVLCVSADALART